MQILAFMASVQRVGPLAAAPADRVPASVDRANPRPAEAVGAGCYGASAPECGRPEPRAKRRSSGATGARGATRRLQFVVGWRLGSSSAPRLAEEAAEDVTFVYM